jgi:hypothetical protein
MRIKLLSDLHLEHLYPTEMISPGSGEILILAGDILTAKSFKTNGYLHDIYARFLTECSDKFDRVLYVLGNHEHYGYCFDHTEDKIRDNLPDNIILLHNNKIIIENWVFLGATFWTDHNRENPIYMMENNMRMNDYSSIRISSNYRKLNADDTLLEHKKSKEYFEQELQNHKDDNVFVVTHMTPSHQSIHEEYRAASLNSAFVSDLDNWILGHPQIKYWAHGHVHNSFDYTIGDCRVICNPHGYRRENRNFNINFEIDI